MKITNCLQNGFVLCLSGHVTAIFQSIISISKKYTATLTQCHSVMLIYLSYCEEKIFSFYVFFCVFDTTHSLEISASRKKPESEKNPSQCQWGSNLILFSIFFYYLFFYLL